MLTKRVLKHARYLVFFAIVTCSSCLSAKKGPAHSRVSEALSPVAVLRWDADPERRELLSLLRLNGIRASMEGEATVVVRVLVPAPDWDRAVSLLRTNHLIADGTVRFPKTEPDAPH